MQRNRAGNRHQNPYEAAHPTPEAVTAPYASAGYPTQWSGGHPWPGGGQRGPPHSDPRSSQGAIPVQRQYMSAVPMGAYPHRPMGTPMGASPPQHGSLLAGGLPTSSHAHLYGSMLASPVHQQGQMHAVKMSSPAQSDTSSHRGMQSSPRISSGFGVWQSPRCATMRPLHLMAHQMDAGMHTGSL
jgi:hypothetical protein